MRRALVFVFVVFGFISFHASAQEYSFEDFPLSWEEPFEEDLNQVLVRSVPVTELESWLVSASRKSPPQKILEFLMELSSGSHLQKERIVITGSTWRELLARKRCTLGSYNNHDILKLLPFHAILQIQFGAPVPGYQWASALTDAWVATLDPNSPDVQDGIVHGKFGNSNVEIGKSRNGERPAGTFGAASHKYVPRIRTGEFKDIYGVVVMPREANEAWITGTSVSNGVKVVVNTSHRWASKVDISKLTPIQCR